MRRITIQYHWEPEGWWADSPDLPGFTAVGDTYEEIRVLVMEGVAEVTEEPFIVVEEGVWAVVELTKGTPDEVKAKVPA